MGWQMCPKCGAPMQVRPTWGYRYWWQCTNGCKQDCVNVRTTASSMTAEEYKKVREENNGRVGFCNTKS